MSTSSRILAASVTGLVMLIVAVFAAVVLPGTGLTWPAWEVATAFVGASAVGALTFSVLAGFAVDVDARDRWARVATQFALAATVIGVVGWWFDHGLAPTHRRTLGPSRHSPRPPDTPTFLATAAGRSDRSSLVPRWANVLAGVGVLGLVVAILGSLLMLGWLAWVLVRIAFSTW